MKAMGYPQVQAKVKRIPLGVKIAYGGAEGASSLAFTVLAIYYLIFLTDVAGINPATAGAILFGVNLWDAVTDPAVGILSDRTRSRFGRRRPYILSSALPFSLVFWLLFWVPPLTGRALTAYYLLLSLLMYLAITILDVPYTAMAPEMTRDYDERTSLVSFRVVWSQVASIFAASVPLVIVDRFSNPKQGWFYTGAIFGLACIFPILLTWRFTRGWEHHSDDVGSFSFGDIFRSMFGNRPFRYFIGIYLFSISSVYASGAIAVYFLQYRMGFTDRQISLFFLFFFLCTVLWVPVITFASNRMGKRGAFILFMSLWGISYGAGNFIIGPGDTLLMYLLAIPGSAGAGSCYQLCWAMIGDVVEVDELKTGKRREGLFYGGATVVMKTGSAFALLLVGQILQRIGYVPNAVQGPGVLLGLRVLFGPVLAGLILLSAFIAYFMPMTRARHRALVEAIEARRRGEFRALDNFKELL
jgi:GPH family glycoside/pentoside/hexuronide:cation symporter